MLPWVPDAYVINNDITSQKFAIHWFSIHLIGREPQSNRPMRRYWFPLELSALLFLYLVEIIALSAVWDNKSLSMAKNSKYALSLVEIDKWFQKDNI